MRSVQSRGEMLLSAKKPFGSLSNSFKSPPLNSLPGSMSNVNVGLPLFSVRLLQAPFLFLLMFFVTPQTFSGPEISATLI